MTCRLRCPVVLLLFLACLATAPGCRRKKSTRNTIVTNGIFTTDDFPGAPVQDGNVADDKRALSEHYYSGGITCTHNGSRGTMMVSYRIDGTVYAHHYDSETWTPPVALRHPDAETSTTVYFEVVHAFVNTENDDRPAARDRDGDCVLLWKCPDLDSDGPGPDRSNTVLFASYFDRTYADDPAMNYGFDINPATPGIFTARRLSVPDGLNENVGPVGVATDGLCGEARWDLSGSSSRYGDATSGIVAFWHQQKEKFPGQIDEVADAAWFDLGAAGDPASPPALGATVELAPMLFGSSDSGATCRESIVGSTFASYNGVLVRRVRTAGGWPAGVGTWMDIPFDLSGPLSPGEDVTLQATTFDLRTGVATTVPLTTVVPDSAPGNTDDVGADFLRAETTPPTPSFLRCAGQGLYGRDEGLSCLVAFFGEVSAADTSTDFVWTTEGSEGAVAIAEVDEDTGALLGSTRVSGNDGTIVDNARPSRSLSTRMSRNGDYIWAAWLQNDTQGTVSDPELYAAEYQTTRVNDDGTPQPVAPLSSALGLPLSLSDNVVDPYPVAGPRWYTWQDNLGYRCGTQSDAAVMSLFFYTMDTAASEDRIYHVRLTADADGTAGGESATAPALLVTDSAESIHDDPAQATVNDARTTFNATDAGSDGDVLYVFVRDGDGVDGADEQYLWAGRAGVTSAPQAEIGSRDGNRQIPRGRPIQLVSTPAGEDIAGWDSSAGGYDDQAHHGAEWVHVLFFEAQTGSLKDNGALSLGSTADSYALRTRAYRCAGASTSVGDSFLPGAGTAFAQPFQVDLPYVDPGTYETELHGVSRCGNTVAVVFYENGHLYYQECNPADDDEPGWRQVAPGVSDPALVDDDSISPVYDTELVSSPACNCCDVDGTAIFWEKLPDSDGYDYRLQVRVVNRGR